MTRLRNVLGGKIDLTPSQRSEPIHDALDFTAENVLAENIYEMTVTFLVQSARE